MSDGEFKQVQGVCDGVMLKGEWHEFHINVGRQYPVKLSTKQPDVIDLATVAGQQQAVWIYKETEGGPNPHRPGENFKNRYLSKVEVGGTLQPQQQLPSTAGGKSSDERQSIERQTVVKAALPAYLAATEFVGEDSLFALMDRTAAWIKGSPAAPPQAAPQTQGAPPVDDGSDIPFAPSIF